MSCLYYHFTCLEHLLKIRLAGQLLPSESNIGSPTPSLEPYGENYGPPVVWLLDTSDLQGMPHGLAGSAYDKTAAAISVDIPAIRWFDWEPARKMNLTWRDILIETGGGIDAAVHWYVWPGPISQDRWRSLILRKEALS